MTATLESLQRLTRALSKGVPIETLRYEVADALSALQLELARKTNLLQVTARRLMEVEEERDAARALTRDSLINALGEETQRMCQGRSEALQEAAALRALLSDARQHLSYWVPTTPALAARIDAQLGHPPDRASLLGGVA